jgi:nucleoside-diphosphate-sugar epimerase
MDFKDVPVLVTGGSGFVGSYIAAWLAERGARVRAVVRKAGPHPGLKAPRITQLEGDFVDPEVARAAVAGARYVFHAAATIGVDLADALRVNATGTTGLAAAAREAGVDRFIHTSTVSVYDFQVRRERYDEEAPLRELGKAYAHSPAASPQYGISKAEAERALRREMERGLPATIFRLSAVLGAHPTSAWAVVVPRKIRAGQVPLRGDGSDKLPWTHIHNVTHAIELALEQPASIGRVYNVVDGEITWQRYIADVRSWFPDAPPPPVIPAEKLKPEDVFLGHCPGERLRADLGYAPRHGYEEGMADAAAWWRSHGDQAE